MFGNPVLPEMLSLVEGMQRSEQILCVLEQLSLGIVDDEEQITSPELLGLSGLESLLQICGAKRFYVIAFETDMHQAGL